MKKFFSTLLIVTSIVIAVVLAAMIIRNNYFAAELSTAEIDRSLDQAIGWMRANEVAILEAHNPALWEMVAQTLAIRKDVYLADLLSRYKKANRYNWSDHPLKFQIYGEGIGSYRDLDLYTYPDYNLLFMYAHSCDESLLDYEVVNQQLSADYCGSGLMGGIVCKTHQLYGLLYFRGNSCLDESVYEPEIEQLIDDIALRTFFEFRVLDNYLQRTMLLYRAGRPEEIRVKWLENIRNAQNADGGWDDFYPLLWVGQGRYLGIERRKIKIKVPRSDFHATIQGILVMAYASLEAEAISR